MNNWIINKSDRILITGANGYLGLKVVEILLEYGFLNLRCMIRSDKNLEKLKYLSNFDGVNIEIFKGNLLNSDDCKKASNGVSLIYHLAAGVEKSFAGCFLNSAVSTRNILESSYQNKMLKRFVNISSIAVYTNENIRRGGILDELCEVDTKFVERHEPYAYGKAKQDDIVHYYAEKYKLPFVILRPSVIFGPGKVKISDRIGTDTFGIFLHLGMSNQIPLTYLDNCAEATVLAGLKKGIDGETFNIVDDNLPSSRKFLKKYKKEVRRFISLPIPYPFWFLFNFLWEKYSKWSHGQLPPVFNRRSCSIYWKKIKYSNKKSKELLGWHPRVNMDDALTIFFSYMRKMEKSNA